MTALQVLALLFLVAPFAYVQVVCQAHPQAVEPSGTASISGTVVDPTGALVPNASVTLDRDGQAVGGRTTDGAARFVFTSLAPGSYTLSVFSPGFTLAVIPNITVAQGERRQSPVKLSIQTEREELSVSSEDSETGSGGSADSVVINGAGLSMLSSDSALMLQQLQAMSGSISDSGAQVYVDGFSGGRVPPREAIREIRIDRGPYSAENDTAGEGRIDISTKAGSDVLHGDLQISGSGSSLDSRNPYSPQPQAFYSTQFNGNLSGRVRRGSSFNASGSQYAFQNSAIVNAVILDSSANQIAFTDVVPSPVTTTSVTPRFDAQLSASNTISLRFQLDRLAKSNAGVGQFALASQGYDSQNAANTLQVSDTQTFGPKVANELRFQYIRARMFQQPADSTPTVVVQGSFTSGGNSLGRVTDNQDQYEIHNYLSIDRGQHLIRFGVRQRFNRDSDRSTANYNGEYIFSTLTGYQITVNGLLDHLAPAQIRAMGGGASQFNITAGDPSAAILVDDSALFASDTWKVKKNLTITMGLRFETQNFIHDRADVAPRFGFSYDIRSRHPETYTLRGGTGIFYTRLSSSKILQTVRQNGTTQRQFVLTSPDTYPVIPNLSDDPRGSLPTIYQIDPAFRSPYIIQASIGLDHRVGKYGTMSLGYANTRGVHQLLTRNINAPLLGTYNINDPSSGVRPLGGTQNLYEYDSMGLSRQDRLSVNTQISNGDKFFFLVDYSYRRVRSDTNGGFPSNQYDLARDYGRASNDIRHHLFLGTFFRKLPFHLSGGTSLIMQSGAPFNIVVAQDLNGDNQFNDRPSFASNPNRPSVLRTAYGYLDTLPSANERRIPINYGHGPGLLVLNSYLGRSFSFGLAPGQPNSIANSSKAVGSKSDPAQHHYTLQLGIEADNLLNSTNPAPPVGTLGSPLFGRSNALNSVFSQGSANRTINLQASFQF